MPMAIGSVPFTCFSYGQPGHKVTDCPVKNAALPTPTLARQVLVQIRLQKNITGAAYGRLTHLTMEDT